MADLTRKEAYFYDLPEELIAQTPVEPRDASRLLFFDPNTKQVEHQHFYNISSFLKKGDVLVLNNTKVIPARLLGVKEDSGINCEIFLLKRIDLCLWECLVKPGRRLKNGARVVFGNGKMTAEIKSTTTDGNRIVEFKFNGIFENILDELGQTPLPPYIHTEGDYKKRYNTVYAKIDGSSAAPTAGLHFTTELLDSVRKMGVEILEVQLNIGLGTFRPVKEEKITDHKMHSEYYGISQYVADRINLAKEEGRRIIAVGTTSTRTLESAYHDGKVVAGYGNTEIFIYPNGPKQFDVIDGLITNFHLPESTLIMLVSAFIGYENTMSVYKEAVNKKYRFFSFGDACFFIKKKG